MVTLHQERGENCLCVVTGICGAVRTITVCVTMVTTIAEGQFDVIIPAPNRSFDHDNNYPLRSKLPAVWADISNAIQGLKEHSTTRVMLDEVLKLELSIVARLLKLRPGVDDNHVLMQQVANDLWFRQMD